MTEEKIRDRYLHCLKRAEQLEAKEERGEGMNSTVVQMMHRYRQLATSYAAVLRDQGIT